jgi:large subunit ribosomal protein L37Ae
MGNTKKVGSTGRYGTRYGVGIRKRLLKVETKQKQKHACPDCGFDRIKRTAPGIFSCSKCHTEFAGGAYLPKTMTGGIVKKIVHQKAFGQQAEELLETVNPTLTQDAAETAVVADHGNKKAEANKAETVSDQPEEQTKPAKSDKKKEVTE